MTSVAAGHPLGPTNEFPAQADFVYLWQACSYSCRLRNSSTWSISIIGTALARVAGSRGYLCCQQSSIRVSRTLLP
eukprot:scaffold382959_cov19-Prasinocladus_malaysianus.AAC.1